MNYYNEIEPYCVQWLRNLIAEGLIPNGHVDNRTIRDVQPGDLAGYRQCHFFAGIAGWSLALAMAEWPADREVWTGSCPCQPFSSAGAKRGFADDRHLWPEWFRLVSQCRPATIFGEQVARASDWLALVRSDLEALGYAVGGMPIEAASVGAPHKRDRFWFVANPISVRELQPQGSLAHQWRRPGHSSETVGDSRSTGLEVSRPKSNGAHRFNGGRMFAPGSWWAVEPSMGRMAHGIPARVGKLRALGNAIVPQVAAEFIRAAS